MEIGAILITALMIAMVAIRVDYWQKAKWKGFANTMMWVIFVFLILNTAGNLSANSNVEKFVFTPVTILLAILAYRLAMRE